MARIRCSHKQYSVLALRRDQGVHPDLPDLKLRAALKQIVLTHIVTVLPMLLLIDR